MSNINPVIINTNPAVTDAEVAETLNDLIRICQDGANGYTKAAERVDAAPVAERLIEFAQQRREFVTELTNLVAARGEEPAGEPTLRGSLHNAWLDMVAAASSGMDAILRECERGESAAVAAYEDALAQALPDRVREVVERQYQAVVEAHRYIQSLHNLYSH